MGNHIYTKKEVEKKLNKIKGKTLGEVDNSGIFDYHSKDKLQKGIAGKVIEKCVFGYSQDTEQKPDLCIDGVKTELKTTGLIRNNKNELIAKENVSITAVSVYTNADETFDTSHFFEKTEHLLFVYYNFLRKRTDKIKPIEYKPFPIINYKFYDIPEDEMNALKKDWENVHELICDITRKYTGEHDNEWKENVKKEYIKRRHEIRDKGLNYIDLAPKWPPRFRFKSDYITYIYRKDKAKLESFNSSINDIEGYMKECESVTRKYYGKTIRELSEILNFELPDTPPKNIGEMIILKMFGCQKGKMSKIDFFVKEGVIPKTIVLMKNKMPKEDTKFFKVDFDDLLQKKIEYIDEDENVCERSFEFEDSEFYRYFTQHQFVGVLFKKADCKDPYENIFIGIERIFFDKKIVDVDLKRLWTDTRNKILKKELKDLPTMKKGKQLVLKNGELSTHPNFMRSTENSVFIKLSARDSSSKNKKEIVNNIKMLPQYVWIGKKTMKTILDYEMTGTINDIMLELFPDKKDKKKKKKKKKKAKAKRKK